MKTHIIENFRLHATGIADQMKTMQVSHSPALSWVDSGFKSDTYNVAFVRVADIYGLCTLEAFRKRGIGTEMMSYILYFAWQAGFENLILHASEAGLGIYQRLGFRAETYLYEYA